MQRRIAVWATATLAFFVLVLAVQAYWQVFAAPWLTALPYDGHQQLRAKLSRPGRVLTHDGVEILSPVRANGGWSYRFDYPEEFSGLTGYDEKTGVRWKLAPALSGQGGPPDWRAWLTEPVPPGCDAILTVDSRAQRAAVEALKGYRGCAVVLRPGDGAVLAAASSPAFNPVTMNTPDEVELLATDPTQPLLFRPTQGLYNPGWAMGWVAAAAVLAEDPAAAKATYDCSGAWQCGRMAVRCPQGHGRLTLAGALSRGCHVALTQAADRMGRDGFRRFLKAAHLLDMAGDLPLQSVAGRLPDLYDWRGRENLADTVIGNRFVRITPWAVARFFAALARQGQVAQPFLVSEVRSPSGRTAEAGRAQELGWAVSPEAASQLLQVLSTEAPRYTAATEQFRGGVDLGGVGVAAWWVPYPDRNGMGCGWLVAMSPMPQAQVLALLVLEDVADDKMAVELGLSLLNSLQRMAV